ncbi:MAG TPA: DUF6318 family protein [Sporichthyaceae bacterium]
MNRLSRLAVPVVAAALTLSACGGGGGDKKDPLASKTPTASPTPVAAPMPDAALKHTDDGAVAFVQFYFNTILTDAYAQGDVKRLVSVSDPNCVVCRATVGDIAFFAAQNDKPQGGVVTVTAVKVAESNSNVTSLNLTYAAAKLAELNQDGSTAYSVAARTGIDFIAQVQWDVNKNSWRMTQILDKKLVNP